MNTSYEGFGTGKKTGSFFCCCKDLMVLFCTSNSSCTCNFTQGNQRCFILFYYMLHTEWMFQVLGESMEPSLENYVTSKKLVQGKLTSKTSIDNCGGKKVGQKL